MLSNYTILSHAKMFFSSPQAAWFFPWTIIANNFQQLVPIIIIG